MSDETVTSLTDAESVALLAMLDENKRLKRLSDRELVFECLAADLEAEAVIEEMMGRLYPRWAFERVDGSVEEVAPKRVYVAGPMTGIEHYNRTAFETAAKTLNAAGYNAITPFDCLTTDDWQEGTRADIRAMLQCEEIFVLPGWQNSKGASLEIQIARTLKMPITELGSNGWQGCTCMGQGECEFCRG